LMLCTGLSPAEPKRMCMHQQALNMVKVKYTIHG
jgi:hypothetical protein